jgi:hypothetical protein
MIYLDSSALKSWSDCREHFRRSQVEKIEQVKQNTHYAFGTATHVVVEEFWKGSTYEKALDAGYKVCNEFPVQHLNPAELETWERLVKALPDISACYFDSVLYEPEKLMWIEKEWSLPYSDKVTLCGRVDRLMVGPRIADVKTASEISTAGIPWRQQYRQDKVLDLQFALYDYMLCQQGTPPIEIYLEVLLKPYKSKAARYEKIELNELITDSYRKRFAQQLKWKVSEIVHYVENYSQQKPWPLAGGLACSSRYGTCQYQKVCAFGESPSIMSKYKPREPHLEIQKQAERKERAVSENSSK